MKVLWIVNMPLGVVSEKLYNRRSNGMWMDALLQDFKKRSEVKLVVATTAQIQNVFREVEDGVVYYALPDTPPLLYDENKESNILSWGKLLCKEQPDIIQVWGTEFTHGLCALRIAKKLGIPSVIYMQGYLGSIARHYFAGIDYRELRKTITIRDFLKHDSIIQQQKKYRKNVPKEKEMLELSGNIISENEWCDKSIQAVVPTLQSYHCPLSVNRVFSQREWKVETAETHSVMCTASGYPLKGLHMMLRALHLLKDKYPDCKLYIPGVPQVSDGTLKGVMRKRGYTKYIERLIRKLKLQDNVVWLGQLDQEQLAECYTKVRVFVLGSSIENHSSSLKEAMMVGVPSIAAAVGGVPEYVRHGENGYLYRFEEYDIMAQYIETLFENSEVAKQFSRNGRETMLVKHMDIDMYQCIMDIYKLIVNKGH